jgi:hypothetical protein
MTDIETILFWGLPGLVVLLVGNSLVVMRSLQGRRKSPLGLRLSAAGFGFFLLGMWGAAAMAAFMVGLWPLAIAVSVLFGWQPLLLFWLATRPRVTEEEPRDLPGDRSNR